MLLRDKPLEIIQETDLVALKNEGISEDLHIEYKEKAPDKSDAQAILKFLAAVSSFANADGGDLILGIQAEENGPTRGQPKQICGLSGVGSPDDVTNRLSNIIAQGIEPRIIGIRMQSVSLQSGSFALLIRIPRSWNPPHMVTRDQTFRFWAREAAGKRMMDVSQLRLAFTFSATIKEQLRDFRLSRLAAITANSGPILMTSGAKIVLHVVPLRAFYPDSQVDLLELAGDQTHRQSMTYRLSSSGVYVKPKHNFDGLVSMVPWSSAIPEEYVQVFRNGSIEAVDTYMLSYIQDLKSIPNPSTEEHIINGLRNFLAIDKSLDVEPPLFVMLSLLGVKGYQMQTGLLNREGRHSIDRDDLIIPEVMIEDLDSDPAIILKPAFDMIWNAAGEWGSYNYDRETGERLTERMKGQGGPPSPRL